MTAGLASTGLLRSRAQSRARTELLYRTKWMPRRFASWRTTSQPSTTKRELWVGGNVPSQSTTSYSGRQRIAVSKSEASVIASRNCAPWSRERRSSAVISARDKLSSTIRSFINHVLVGARREMGKKKNRRVGGRRMSMGENLTTKCRGRGGVGLELCLAFGKGRGSSSKLEVSKMQWIGLLSILR